MISLGYIRSFALLTLAVFVNANPLSARAAEDSGARTTQLRCDHLDQPLGIDDLRPRLSWQMQSTRHGAAQSAYRITVATDPAKLHAGSADMWDSGRVRSDLSVDIPYSGSALASHRRYYWTVQVWDEHGKLITPAGIGEWEMGLLQPAEWDARWISSDTPEDRADRAAAPKWIWVDGEDALHHAHSGSHQFRLDFKLASKPVEATLFLTAKDTASVWLNNQDVMPAPKLPAWGPSYPWGTFRVVDVTAHLKEGNNVLAAEAIVAGTGPRESAGLIALLRVKMADGSIVRYVSDASWKATAQAADDWRSASFDDQSWKPAIVAAQLGENPLGTPWPAKPANLFRRTLRISKQILSARLYVTALGSYQMSINGTAIGDEVLAPGWTDYRRKLYYQTYDVTRMLHRGGNVLGALLGDGWYGSGLITYQQRFNFGPPPLRLLAQLRIEFTDGTSQIVGTDASWQTSPSAVVASDLYNGETFDAREEQPGWDANGFHPRKLWANATLSETPKPELVAQNFEPIKVERHLAAVRVSNPSSGVYIFDMGQNMVGTEALRVAGPRGTRVRLRFGEVLQPDGQLYNANMRTAQETDTYTLRGSGEEVFIPHFTYHGYRYIEVTGYPGRPAQSALKGIVFHTNAALTGSFHSGSTMLNQLWSNILWGQRGNFESIPTDCPQRDERLGWMGDAQVFWRTASYNMGLAAFSEKFAGDMRIAQAPDGNFSDITPRVGTVAGEGSPGWADAGVIIPYTAWKQYGDTRLLVDSWPSMERYLAAIARETPDHISRRHAYGDWLAIGSTTPQDLIATAYWAYDAELMATMAKALGRTEDAEKYQTLFQDVSQAFAKKFVGKDGSVGSNSQTSYILALRFNLVPQELRASVADRLVADLESHTWHLTTGFLGTPYIMSVLSDTGHSDIAYKVLLTSTYPSWGYMVQHGATTMWERWNGDQMLGDPGMNSFNHYAYGAVGEWLYRYLAGIDLSDGDTAFHHFLVHPQFTAAIGHSETSYQSSYGTISSSWKDSGATVDWTLVIPANTTATISLPRSANDQLSVDGKPVASAGSGVTVSQESAHEFRIEAKAGLYHFILQRAALGDTEVHKPS